MPDIKFIVYNIKGLPVGGTNLRKVRIIANRIDLWQVKRPGEPGFTYSTNNPNQRIDYVLSFPHLPSNNAEKLMGMECKEISTLPWQESDHLPISAVFSLPNS